MRMNEEIRVKEDQHAEKLSAAGVKFQRSKYFAEYGVIGNKTIELGQAAGLLATALSDVQDGTYADITEAIESLADERKPLIEYCTNDEWLHVYGNYEDESDEYGVDTQRWESDKKEMFTRFTDDVVEVEFDGARGQRIMCHGWNGAGFSHRSGGFGTFCALTEEGERVF